MKNENDLTIILNKKILEYELKLKVFQDVEEDELPEKDMIEKIMIEKWKYSQTYSIASAENVEERQPLW